MGVVLELGMNRNWKGFEECVRECPDSLEQIFNRDLDFVEAVSECLKESEEHVTGNWRKEDSC